MTDDTMAFLFDRIQAGTGGDLPRATGPFDRRAAGRNCRPGRGIK